MRSKYVGGFRFGKYGVFFVLIGARVLAAETWHSDNRGREVEPD